MSENQLYKMMKKSEVGDEADYFNCEGKDK